jgi:uncharacterized membrane protein YkvA (DUF1232 family)
MDIKFEDLKAKFGKKAKEYAGDKKKTQKLVNDAMKKAKRSKKEGSFEEIWDNIQLLFQLAKDWSTAQYTQIPIGSMIAIIMGLLYFVSPIDFVPDFLPGGLIDDAFVLSLIIRQIKTDLYKYKEWKEISTKEIID